MSWKLQLGTNVEVLVITSTWNRTSKIDAKKDLNAFRRLSMNFVDKTQLNISRSKNERNTIVYSKVQDNLGYIRPPLLDIEPSQCIPDFLHMKKGVINRLLNQVIVKNCTLQTKKC